jgi:GT2 family glycosyltransferase
MTISIIIVAYNTRELVRDCLASLKKAEASLKKAGYSMQVIVSDNGSDDTGEMVKKEFSSVLYQKNENVGFAKGNNIVKDLCKGTFILMLNPDTRVEDDTLPESLRYMESHPDVGAMTCKIEMSDGSLDKDARRSFPTPWVAFTHITKLDRLFPTSRLFARYWYGYLPEDKESEVDVLEGAYCLVRRSTLDEIGWYDEDYFLNGEDIDLCWKIKETGKKIIYYPDVKIYHFKGATKGKSQNKAGAIKVDKATKRKVIVAGSDAMKIFYNKRLKNKYSPLTTGLILSGIFVMKQIRLARFNFLNKV